MTNFQVGDKVYLKRSTTTLTGVAHPIEKEFFVTGIVLKTVALAHTPGGPDVLITSPAEITHDKIPTSLWEHLEGQGDA